MSDANGSNANVNAAEDAARRYHEAAAGEREEMPAIARADVEGSLAQMATAAASMMMRKGEIADAEELFGKASMHATAARKALEQHREADA